MAYGRRKAPEFRPWVEQVAGLIGDPVRRLRFLRVAAPLAGVANAARGAGRGRRWRRIALLMCLCCGIAAFVAACRMSRSTSGAELAAPAAPARPSPARPISEVWRVEKSGNDEVYSNGLRIDNAYAVSNRPRAYLVFPAEGQGPPAPRSEPAGIVFHSTESQSLPFEAGHNDALKRAGESLLDYVRRRRSYHFLIGRFGRVHRVVAEPDAANHAGYSVWADDRGLYVNLNESFLGIAFEAQTRREPAAADMTAAQARSGVMLVEMLRGRYRMAAGNCVTHAQVSVNPSNLRAGYHVDWASAFPFEQLGLPNNYAVPLPSIASFGFEADEAFRTSAGAGLRAGLDAGMAILERGAAAAGLRRASYQARLRRRYREMLAAARRGATESDGDAAAH